MELTITNNREIKPYKVAVKQFESETTTLTFTRDSYMYDQVDLRNYKAYAVTSIGGAVDMTELTYEIVGGKLVITWVVQENTLRQAGNITYQIVFKENADDGEGTGVFYTYEALLQCSESIDTDRPIAANYPTILKQWLDLINNLSGTISAGIVYMGVGQAIPVESRLAGQVYYQIEDAETYDGHFEDYLGNKLGKVIGEHQADADINKLITHGDYICSGTLLNAPINCTYCMVRVTDTLSTDKVIQEVYVPADDNTVRVFVRVVIGLETFGAWCELAKKGTVAPNMVLVSDANGNIVSHANVSAQELNALNGFIIGSGTVQTQLNSKKGYVDYSTGKTLVSAQSGNATVTAPYDCMVAIVIKYVKSSSGDNTKFGSAGVTVDSSYVGNITCHPIESGYAYGMEGFATNTLFLPVKSGQSISVVPTSNNVLIQIAAYEWN